MFSFSDGDIVTPTSSCSDLTAELPYEVFHTWTIDGGDSIDRWAVLWDPREYRHITVLCSEFLYAIKGEPRYVYVREFATA